MKADKPQPTVVAVATRIAEVQASLAKNQRETLKTSIIAKALAEESADLQREHLELLRSLDAASKLP